MRRNRLPQEILNYYSKTAGSLSMELYNSVELDWMEQKKKIFPKLTSLWSLQPGQL